LQSAQERESGAARRDRGRGTYVKESERKGMKEGLRSRDGDERDEMTEKNWSK
jgi:hypothetical protein